jgi:sugar/nucleoside kinase (ribokinase family)
MEPSKAILRKILQMARSVDILVVSLDEAVALTGTRDPLQAFAAPCERAAVSADSDSEER